MDLWGRTVKFNSHFMLMGPFLNCRLCAISWLANGGIYTSQEPPAKRKALSHSADDNPALRVNVCPSKIHMWKPNSKHVRRWVFGR